MNYYYTKPKLKPCKYPLKSSSLELLDFICIHKVSVAHEFMLNYSSIILQKNQYLSTYSRLSKNLNLSVKSIRHAIDRLKEKNLLETTHIKQNNKIVGTIFEVLIGEKKGTPNSKKGHTNFEKRAHQITRQKQVKNMAKKRAKKLGFQAQNKYNVSIEDNMKKEYQEMTDSLRKKLINDIPQDKIRAHHINKEELKEKKIEVINNFLKEKKVYFDLELGTEELLKLFENFLFEYQQTTNADKIKPEFYIEKWAIGIYHSWFTIENLCAMRGYFNAQKAKNQKVEFFKAFTRLIECVQEPSENEPGYHSKMRDREVFLATYAKQGYKFYYDKIMPSKQRQVIDEQENKEKQKRGQEYSFAQKYWVTLTENNPSEADIIADKADILFKKCSGSGYMKLFNPRANKEPLTESQRKHLENIRFGCIEAELEKIPFHATMLNLKKLPLKTEVCA